MNNLSKSAEIRRAIENAPYNELQTFPKRRFRRGWWVTDDSFELTHEDIYLPVLEALEAKFDEVPVQMIDTNIEVFLESEEYDVMRHEARAEYEDGLEYEHDPYSYFGVSSSDFMSIRSNGL